MEKKKRLVYAEDLFAPVDYNVLVIRKGGPQGGKTMAMYEELFRKRVEMAPTIDAVEVVRCKDCKHYKEHPTSKRMCCYAHLLTPHYMREDGFCSYGERIDNHEQAE